MKASQNIKSSTNYGRKILFGAIDIGWRIELYSKFIKSKHSEIKVESFVKFFVTKGTYKTNYTYQYNIFEKNKVYRYLISLSFFVKSLFRYDTLHIISGENLLTRKLRKIEFKIYKLLDKRLIMHFVGADIRSPLYLDWKTKNINLYLNGTDQEEKSLDWQKKLIADSQNYADAILVSTPDLLKLIPTATYYPVMIDSQKFLSELPKKFERNKEHDIVILHAPSNPRTKGTAMIHSILKKIKSESTLNIKLILTADSEERYSDVYTTSRYDLFKYYVEADIVVDQLVIGWYGLQAIEALLSENQVVSYIDQSLEQHLFPNCPITSANANSFEQVVTTCIDKKLNQSIDFDSQIKWVMKHHTIESNNEALLNAWNFSK